MTKNIHPGVELLDARMESNPEEFEFHASGSLAVTGRWETWIAQLGWHFNGAEKALIYGKARELIFQRIHEEVLDELMNGPDKRRKEEEEREYERSLMMQQALAQQQKAYVSQIQGMVGQVYGGGGGGGAGIVGSYDYDLDKYRNTPTGSITSAATPKPSPYDKIMNALKKGK